MEKNNYQHDIQKSVFPEENTNMDSVHMNYELSHSKNLRTCSEEELFHSNQQYCPFGNSSMFRQKRTKTCS